MKDFWIGLRFKKMQKKHTSLEDINNHLFCNLQIFKKKAYPLHL